jgi:hypothetical protein
VIQDSLEGVLGAGGEDGSEGFLGVEIDGIFMMMMMFT